MSGPASRDYDIAIVGAGPVGSLCALAHARKGFRVALLEGNPKSSRRMAGEWLHPPAVRILRDLGICLDTKSCSISGKGFVLLPEDRSDPIVLPYSNGSDGLTCDHAVIVSTLREAVGNDPDVDFMPYARVHAVEDGRVAFTRKRTEEFVTAGRIVGADGRGSIVRKSLGLSATRRVCSRMVGVKLNGVRLPLEGYGYVLCGGPGPVLMYHLNEDCVRVIVDVPVDHWIPQDRIRFLSDSYAGLLPDTLRPAFVEALQAGRFDVAVNELRLRLSYGNSRRVLIGDAVGHFHPMTAVGMTLGFEDALTLAESEDFHAFATRRYRSARTPDLLGMGLYEIFADHRTESVALRNAIYRSCRSNPRYRSRTIRLISCEDISTIHLGLDFLATVTSAIVKEIPRSCDLHTWRRFRDMVHAILVRLGWLLRGINRRYRSKTTGGGKDESAFDALARAFLTSIPDPKTTHLKEFASHDAGPAIGKAVRRLMSLQNEDGAWEGEMVWCPMLAAQYVLLHHIIEHPIRPGRQRRLLRQFESTRLADGMWGLHEHSRPHLFVTTLVYVAMRLLGTERNDPSIEPARQFLQAEGVSGIPSWGKFWLALLSLYEWRGVNAVLPELWSLPRWMVLHPANWYCHTRLIYMAMTAIFPHRFQVPATPLIESLREELFPQGFSGVDFPSSRNRLRTADLYMRPSVWLRIGYGLARTYERLHSKRLRARCMDAITRHIKWELQTTSHASISPVSGILNIIALWLRDPDDTDCRQAIAQLDGWIWEDEEQGTRITGARSTSWDTGFSLQALATVSEFDGVRNALRNGADFLCRQQIDISFEGYREAYRTDPRGGWCFAGGWHGWPVTDCTAEAVLGIIKARPDDVNMELLGNAVRFMLRGQNRDGGFGSYEARRTIIGLEWLNPAEMFGDSMTEHSHVECTASCLEALAACRKHFPQVTDNAAINAMRRSDAWLRRTQAGDGSWRGTWGVQYIYGTYFGIRGLIAAGARPGDPALRLACRWLLDHQREDGGWGEHHSGCLTGRYVAHEKSQVIQTAWALIALLVAGDPNWSAISRGARHLIDKQHTDGTWPKQDMAGVFFRTALLDYVLYRQYFPLHALGLYEQRRQARDQPAADAARRHADRLHEPQEN